MVNGKLVNGFEFSTAGRILFGAGKFAELPAAVATLGRRVFLVTGKDPARVNTSGLEHVSFRVPGEPTVDLIREGVSAFRGSGCDVVVAIGGGSALDAAKAIAAAATNPGDLIDYLEVIGKGLPLVNPPLPVIAVPTTAGTGSEVTRNAVLGSPRDAVKVSLRHPLMLPRIAIVDPELTLGLPHAISASTGLDALTQLIEPWVSGRANAFTDCFCPQGIAAAARALPRIAANQNDLEARSLMSWASLLGGMALANAGLGVVHGLAAPIGGSFPAPHGAVCAALLPYAVAANVRALRQRAPESEALRRYGEIAAILVEDRTASPEEAAAWLLRLIRQLGIPPLSKYGIAPAHWSGLAERAQRSSSMKANPIALSHEEIIQILQAEDGAIL
jgi:alcohol dehydrogenase class IV